MTNPINEMMESSLEKIRTMADSNTVIGQAITTPDGTTVIPISRVKFSFAGGGSEFTTKNSGDSKPYGGGAGAVADITPIAFLIAKDGNCRVLPIPMPASTSLDRVIEQVPDAVDKIWTFVQEKTGGKTED